jgi:hypothetical protein
MAVGQKRVGVAASYGLDHSVLETYFRTSGSKSRMVNFHEGTRAYFVFEYSGNPILPPEVVSRCSCSFRDISDVAEDVDQGFRYVLHHCERSREHIKKETEKAIKDVEDAILSGKLAA